MSRAATVRLGRTLTTAASLPAAPSPWALVSEIEIYAAALAGDWARGLELAKGKDSLDLARRGDRVVKRKDRLASTAVYDAEKEAERESSLRLQEKSVRGEFVKRLSALSPWHLLARLRGGQQNGKGHVHKDGNDDRIMAPWIQRLELARQWFGTDGVLMIFELVREHRDVYRVRGPLTKHFWGTILRASLGKERAVEHVVEYALWMVGEHGSAARWPGLWVELVGGLIERRQLVLARQVHGMFVAAASLKKQHGYLPTEEELAAVVTTFVGDASEEIQRALMGLYATTKEQTKKHGGKMYDEVVPVLFKKGHSRLARRWRKILLDHGDVPEMQPTSPSKPFLRFLHSIHDSVPFIREERVILGLEDDGMEEYDNNNDDMTAPTLFMGLPRLAYRTVPVPGISDMQCARYLATPSFSYASVAATLQIKELGPLAMQAIARREGGVCSAISRRLAELEGSGVSVGPSAYARFVRRLVDTQEDGLLGELLKCDVHPDEFNRGAGVVQHRLVADAIARGDLARYRLLMAFQLAGADRATGKVLNNVLLHAVDVQERRVFSEDDETHEGDQHSTPLITQVLGDMAALGAHIPRSGTKPALLNHYFHYSSPSHAALGPSMPSPTAIVPDVLNVARHMADMGWRPSASSWRDLLFRLGRLGRLDDLESVCAYLVDVAFATPSPPARPRDEPFTDTSTPPPDWGSGLVGVNKRDVPRYGMYTHEPTAPLPLDILLPSAAGSTSINPHHPLRTIFDGAMIKALVRWGFTCSLAVVPTTHSTQGRRAMPRDWDFARGVRLVRVLVEKCGGGAPLFGEGGTSPRAKKSGGAKDAMRGGGVLCPAEIEPLVRNAIVALLAGLRLCRIPAHPSRTDLSLLMLRDMLNSAWDSNDIHSKNRLKNRTSNGPNSLLPSVRDLEDIVSEKARRRVHYEVSCDEQRTQDLDAQVMDMMAGKGTEEQSRRKGRGGMILGKKGKRVSYLKNVAKPGVWDGEGNLV